MSNLNKDLVVENKKRKSTEAALRQSEAHYRIIFKNAPGGICMVSLDGVIIDCNKTMAHILGCTQKEVKQQRLYAFMSNKADEAYFSSQLYQADVAVNLELEMVHKTGSIIFGDISIQSVIWKDEKVALVSLLDITKRRVAQAALQKAHHQLEEKVLLRTKELNDALKEVKKSEVKFRTIFDSASDAIIIHELNGDFIEVNQVVVKQLGYLKEEFADHSLSNMSNEYIQMLNSRMDAINMQGNVIFETDFTTKLGKSIAMEINVRIIEYGGRSAILSVARDISERRRAEAERQRIFSMSQDMISISDFKTNFRFINQAFEKTLGYTSEELLATPFIELIHPDDRLTTMKTVTMLECGQQVTDFENRQIAKNGDVHWVSWRSTPDLDLRLIYSIARDVTKRRTFEDELKNARMAAEEANRAKSEFLANMSHELRTPLNAILGFSQLMVRDALVSKSQREHLRMINRSGEHLLLLINDILDMSKIESGRIQLNMQSFELKNMLYDIGEMFQLRANKKNLKFIVDIDPNVPDYVKCDEQKLRQVLINLLGNAVKFTEKGHVLLKVYPGQAYHKLFFNITDSGPGIFEEEQSLLFNAFFRSTHDYKNQEGTGLGLAISRRFVELMGGEITVESQVGQGAVFKFDIQIKPADKTAIKHQPKAKPVIGLEPGQPVYRILVVEDKEESRILLYELLTSVGFDVKTAADGMKAVLLFETWQPHLIYMDMRMPVMDGYEATHQIRQKQNGADTKIIALTASAFDQDRSEIFLAGCNEIISKPFQDQEIFESIRKYLNLRYIYGEQSSSDAALNSCELTITDLQKLPVSWKKEFCREVREGDQEAILSCLQQIQSDYPNMARLLVEMVENFQFDKLMDLIEQLNEPITK